MEFKESKEKLKEMLAPRPKVVEGDKLVNYQGMDAYTEALMEKVGKKQDKQDFNLLTDAKTVVGAINEVNDKVANIDFSKLEEEIENNRTAISNHKAEVDADFTKRDEVVVLFETAKVTSGTFGLKENIKKFKEVEIHGRYGGTIYITPFRMLTNQIIFTDSNDNDKTYAIGFDGNHWASLLFRTNGENVTIGIHGGSIYKIVGIGRVK